MSGSVVPCNLCHQPTYLTRELVNELCEDCRNTIWEQTDADRQAEELYQLMIQEHGVTKEELCASAYYKSLEEMLFQEQLQLHGVSSDVCASAYTNQSEEQLTDLGMPKFQNESVIGRE